MGDYDYSFKVILLGDCGVGKSTLVKELSKKRDYLTAHCCCYSFIPNSNVDLLFERHGRRINLKIIDTGGQERYRSMTTSYFRGALGCLLMFDVNNINSFESLHTWIETLDTYNSSDIFTTVLVGSQFFDSTEIEIPETRINKFADNFDLPYMRLHLNDTESIIKVLQEMVDIMMRKFHLRQKSNTTLISCDSIEIDRDNNKERSKCPC